MTDVDQLKAALQFCQSQRDTASNQLIDAFVQIKASAEKIVELEAALKTANTPTEQPKEQDGTATVV